MSMFSQHISQKIFVIVLTTLLVICLSFFIWAMGSFTINKLQKNDFKKLINQGQVLKGHIVKSEPFYYSYKTQEQPLPIGPLHPNETKYFGQGIAVSVEFIDPSGKKRTINEIWNTELGSQQKETVDVYCLKSNWFVKEASAYNQHFQRENFSS